MSDLTVVSWLHTADEVNSEKTRDDIGKQTCRIVYVGLGIANGIENTYFVPFEKGKEKQNWKNRLEVHAELRERAKYRNGSLTTSLHFSPRTQSQMAHLMSSS